MSSEVVSTQKIEILNKYGEKLVGVLHSTGSKNLVILCHGFQCSKDYNILQTLVAALTREGLSAFCFDFSGNGESEGEFQFGNYSKEVDDLHAVVLHFLEKNFKLCAIGGHSKGGNVVLLYASMHKDSPIIINLSGRFDLERGIVERLGEDFMARIKKNGFIDVKDEAGNFDYRVTEQSLMERLNTDMRAACHSIDKDCRVLTIHGAADEIIPSEDAIEFDKLIPNHRLHIIEGADHCYTAHKEELAPLVLNFIKSAQVVDATAAHVA